MNWVTSLRDQLPLLLVLSPLIGFGVACLAARFEPKLIRPFAIANMLCTLAILCGLELQFESDLSLNADVIHLAEREIAQSGELAKGPETLSDIQRTLDRLRTERLRYQWFVVDGINLTSLVLVTLFFVIVIWQTDFVAQQDHWIIPSLLLLEGAVFGTIMANDLRVFLFATTASTVAMSLLIGRDGTAERRNHAERFLMTQLCGIVLITVGFSILIIAVPWMKFADSSTIPDVTWNIVSITADIQKWMPRNELAFHYASEVLPWMLLLLSVGFAIQSGLFPFHLSQVRIVSDSSPVIAILYLVGSLSAARIGWLRFVMPLAPDLLVQFDRWLLIPSLVGAIWGSLSALAAIRPRERAAFLFMSISGIILFGCYALSRVGISGAWLMQQQLTVFACLFLLGIKSRNRIGASSDSNLKVTGVGATSGEIPRVEQRHFQPRPTNPVIQRGQNYHNDGALVEAGSFDEIPNSKSLLLMICVPMFGFFASGYVIVAELLFDNLLLVGTMFVVGLLNVAAILSMLNVRYRIESQNGAKSEFRNWISASLIVALLCVIVVNIFPSLLLHQCEPEFARVFRRFEYSAMADSAETSSDVLQKRP